MLNLEFWTGDVIEDRSDGSVRVIARVCPLGSLGSGRVGYCLFHQKLKTYATFSKEHVEAEFRLRSRPNWSSKKDPRPVG